MIAVFASLVHATPLASGTFTLGGRAYQVQVPATTPAPVLIALHGNGGEGEGALRSVSGNSYVAANYIVVGPDGPERSWNIIAEDSNEDDQLYIGTTLVSHLATYSNVVPEFTLFGTSNGAALTNRILIENDDPRIKGGATFVSQLNTKQYNTNTFFIGGASNAYTTPKASLTKRRLLQVVGGQDRVIPAAGGRSSIPDGTSDGRIMMNEWKDSLYAYAGAYGYTGAEIPPLKLGSSQDEYVTYPTVDVTGVWVADGGHQIPASTGTVGGTVLAAFLSGNVSAGLADGGSAPDDGSGGTGEECSTQCAAEFERCTNFGTNNYERCRTILNSDDTNSPLFARGGCMRGCADTASMSALTDGGGPPDPGRPRPGGTPPDNVTSDEPASVATVALTCAGTVSDFTPAKLDDVCGKIATAGGLEASAASCTVKAASVIITATLTVPAGTAVQSVVDTLSTALADPSIASAALGVTVESTPTFTDSSGNVVAPSGGGLSTGALIGIIVGAVVGVLLVGVLIYCTMCKSRGTSPTLKAGA